MKARFGVGVFLGVLLGAAPGHAQPLGDCSHDELRIEESAVQVTVCAPPVAGPRRGEGRTGRAVEVSISETFSANGESFSRTVPLEFMEGSETSRTIDDVRLDKLGIAKTLHLTIGYRPGLVRLEHAMLLPGAVSLK